jgi:hypothetical protein
MSINRHKWSREKAILAARARWGKTHADMPLRDVSAPLESRLLRQVTIADLLTGARHTLDFYGTARLNQYDVRVDGKPWRVCGWSTALAMARKSCVRFGREA